MLERIRHGSRVGGDAGFTTIELLVVIFLIGILLAVAESEVRRDRDRQATKEAKAHLNAALPAVAVYLADKKTYVGMNSVKLVAIDPRISPTLTVASARTTGFCLTDTVNGRTWSVSGPGPKLSFHANDDCS